MTECLNCGKIIQQTPGKRKRQFCNSTCRSNYWQKASRVKIVAPPEDKYDSPEISKNTIQDEHPQWQEPKSSITDMLAAAEKEEFSKLKKK